MADVRSISSIITDIRQIIEDLSDHGDEYDIAIELAHQLNEEIINNTDERDLEEIEDF